MRSVQSYHEVNVNINTMILISVYHLINIILPCGLVQDQANHGVKVSVMLGVY